MKLNYLVIHATMTQENKSVKVRDIVDKHLDKGFDSVCYSDIIDLDGKIISLTKYNPTGRCSGWTLGDDVDTNARHVAYVGGVNKDSTYLKDTRTKAQKETLEIYVKYLIKRHPSILIAGHNQFNSKNCPNFNIKDWLISIGIDKKNIYT